MSTISLNSYLSIISIYISHLYQTLRKEKKIYPHTAHPTKQKLITYLLRYNGINGFKEKKTKQKLYYIPFAFKGAQSILKKNNAENDAGMIYKKNIMLLCY